MFKANEEAMRNKEFYNACAKKKPHLQGQGVWKRNQLG